VLYLVVLNNRIVNANSDVSVSPSLSSRCNASSEFESIFDNFGDPERRAIVGEAFGDVFVNGCDISSTVAIETIAEEPPLSEQ
jgi:hypothetical protein